MRESCPVEYADRERYNSYLDAQEKALCSQYGYQKIPATISPMRRLIGRIKAKLQTLNIVGDGVKWGRIR